MSLWLLWFGFRGKCVPNARSPSKYCSPVAGCSTGGAEELFGCPVVFLITVWEYQLERGVNFRHELGLLLFGPSLGGFTLVATEVCTQLKG